MSEIWKPIPGYEGIYEVSNFGAIKRVAGWTDGRPNRVRGLRRLNPKRYMRVTLFRDGAKKEFPVHKLVYEAFNGPIPDGKETNHKNGQKHDNRLENLEAVTHSKNQEHSYRVLGRVKVMLPGSQHRNAKLTEETVLLMRRLRSYGLWFKHIAARYGVHSETVRDAVLGKTWHHI